MTTTTKNLIRVRYFNGSNLSPREYHYFSEEPLQVGDIITVPARDTMAKAQVTAVGVSETEIEKFRNVVRTIPAKKETPPEPPAISEQILQQDPGPTGHEETAVIKVNPGLDPAFIALSEEALGLQRYASTRIILTDNDVKTATDDLGLISKLLKAVEAKKQEYVQPINERLKDIRAKFELLTAPIEQADKLTRQKIMVYRQEQERRRKEAEEVNRQADELARRQAALNNGEFTVNTDPVPVPPAPPAHVRTDISTLGTMKVRRWEVADLKQVPEEYKIVDAARITKVVKAGIPSIPGIRIFEEETLTVRSK